MAINRRALETLLTTIKVITTVDTGSNSDRTKQMNTFDELSQNEQLGQILLLLKYNLRAFGPGV